MFNILNNKLNILYFWCVVVNHCYEKGITTKSLFIYWLGCLENALLLESAFSISFLLDEVSDFLFTLLHF